MKRTIFLITAVCIATTANAQVRLTSLTVTEGKGAMTSGIDFTIMLEGQNDWIYGAQSNNERANLRVGKRFGDLTVLLTGGAFRNVPWVGPMAYYNVAGFDFFTWSGMGMGTDASLTEPGRHPQFFFNYEEAGYTLGNNRVAYSVLWFTTSPVNHFLIYKRMLPLGKSEQHQFFIETTWHFAEGIPLFTLGYKHSFNE